MENLYRFFRLSAAERWLLIKAALLLEVIKLGMLLLPFRTLRRLLARTMNTRIRLQRANRLSPERVSWAVVVASQHTPGVKTCMAQALAAQVLLARRGYPALIHIGVVSGEREQFQAHAWVETEGKVVIGGLELERYAPLGVLKIEGSGKSRDQKL
jgi:hypothetical protein